MPVSEQTYEQVALEDPKGLWELMCGDLRRKPGLTTRHGFTIGALHSLMSRQLDVRRFMVRADPLRLAAPSGNRHIPDLCVLPRVVPLRRLATNPDRLEVYVEPALLVVEVWSRSTGGRDRRTKLADYQLRGDLEIWLIHPRRRTLRAWRRQPDGTYVETGYDSGEVPCLSLPGVTIDLATLFETS